MKNKSYKTILTDFIKWLEKNHHFIYENSSVTFSKIVFNAQNKVINTKYILMEMDGLNYKYIYLSIVSETALFDDFESVISPEEINRLDKHELKKYIQKLQEHIDRERELIESYIKL